MSTLHLNSVDVNVRTLGPGPAVAIWTQGCPLTCRGCMSPETTRMSGGARADVGGVAGWLASRPERNLTLSGGEPSIQASALNELLERLGESWTVTAYSGFDLTQLQEHGPHVKRLLERLDLLIAGPYVRDLHAALLWRGSSNQVIHNLSGRVSLPADETAGVEVRVAGQDVEAIGVPSAPDYNKQFAAGVSDKGLRLLSSKTHRTFPFPTEEA